MVLCFFCGKVIQDEDLILKNIQLSMVNAVQRQAFHKECWREYHSTETKKSALAYGGLAVFFFGAIFVAYLGVTYGALYNGIIPIVALVSLIAVLVFLGIKYYRISK